MMLPLILHGVLIAAVIAAISIWFTAMAQTRNVSRPSQRDDR